MKSDEEVAVVVMVCCDEDPVWLLLLRDEFVVESVGGALKGISEYLQGDTSH